MHAPCTEGETQAGRQPTVKAIQFFSQQLNAEYNCFALSGSSRAESGEVKVGGGVGGRTKGGGKSRREEFVKWC